jgi:hypothetical protein
MLKQISVAALLSGALVLGGCQGMSQTETAIVAGAAGLVAGGLVTHAYSNNHRHHHRSYYRHNHRHF